MANMTYVNEYSPSVVFPPGDTLKELLEDYSMTQDDLAKRMGKTPKFVSHLINGKAPLDEETAIILERIFNPKASFWLQLETSFRTSLAKNNRR